MNDSNEKNAEITLSMCPTQCCVRLHFGMTTVRIGAKSFSSFTAMMQKALPEVQARRAQTEAVSDLAVLKGGLTLVPGPSGDEASIIN